MSQDAFSRWAPDGSPIVVDYSQEVVEGICALAIDGFQRLARGGVEVGGVLFGLNEDGRVVIHAYRPVECTYARGPHYVLSESDRVRFAQTVQAASTDPDLQGLLPVGWFVSHTRSEMVVTANDREIADAWFPQPWQVLLLLRPGRGGATRAGFVTRDPDGVLRADQSPLEFNLDPPRKPQTMAITGGGAPSVLEPSPRTPASAPVEIPELPLPQAGRSPLDRPRKHWIIAGVATIVVLAVMIAGILFFYPPSAPPPPAPIALQLRDDDGEMRLVWNRRAAAIVKARSGVIEISDDGKKRSVSLKPEQLAVGEWPFLRGGGDVRVVLRVKDETGKVSEEVARFLGQPLKPAVVEDKDDSGEPDEDGAPTRRSDLKAENKKLRQDLKKERARAAGLEKKVTQLTDMLRIERDRSEVLRKK